MSMNWRILIANLSAAIWLCHPAGTLAQGIGKRAVTYADLADLSFSAGLVALAKVDTMIQVDPSRSPGTRFGFRRYYIEAQAQALLVSNKPLGRAVRYLVDLPVNERGRAENLEGEEVFIFARRVAGKPGELQLVTPTAQLRWNPLREAQLRRLLRAAVSPDAPPSLTGVRALLHVPGALLGQGRTQIFLNTQDGSFASITVHRHPGTPPSWNVSFSELIDDAGKPPEPDTLQWYRLACSLPVAPPLNAQISSTEQARANALADYRLVLDSLGPCSRSLHFRPQVTPQSYFAQHGSNSYQPSA